MKVCVYCGHELADDAKVCPACGKEVVEEIGEVVEDAVEEVEDVVEDVVDEVEDVTEEAEEVYEDAVKEAKDAYEDVADEVEEVYEDAVEEVEDAVEEVEDVVEEVDDGFEEVKKSAAGAAAGAAIMDAATKCYRFITRKDDEPQIWQLGVSIACVLAAIFFLISTICGAIYALPGIPAALLFGYFMLKKPKFNAVCMLIPILLFALTCVSIGANFNGYVDVSADTLRDAEAIGNNKENDISKLNKRFKISDGDYWNLDSDQREKFLKEREKINEKYENKYEALTKRAENVEEVFVHRIASENADISEATVTQPIHADVIIFRIFTYAIAALYILALLGILKNGAITMYAILGLSGASSLYYFIRMFTVAGGGPVLYYLAAFFFMGGFAAFIFFSEKMAENRKSRMLSRLIKVTPSNAKPHTDHAFDTLGGGLLAARIAALAIGGILALLGVYVIVLMFVTLADMETCKFGYILIAIMQVIVLAGGAYMSYLLSEKIAKRDDSFLKHYFVTAALYVAILFMLLSTPVIGGWGVFGLTVAALALVCLGAMYFIRSKRVYVYFDTDKYLTQCTLTKNIQPPQL